MSSEKQIFTLKQVTGSIQKIIQERYQQLYWVHAEMHKLNFTNKGHCYPELVQKHDGKIVAEMRGTIWSSQFEKISKNFEAVVKEPLRDGLILLFQVKINFHPLYGMGLEIIDIDPTYTLGELHKEREETLRKLLKEGLLNKNQLLNMPLLPQRIAIISVESSKGLSDFFSVMKDNKWNYHFFTHLFPAQLNGDNAIASVQQQLKRIEKVQHHFDVVAIIRGGGGEIGLSCFNNYELSKAVACFPLPVLTGIGHSTNITVAEMVAYKSAITPTELADIFIQAFHNFSVPLKEMLVSLQVETKRLITYEQKLIKNEVRLFKNVSQSRIIQERQFINNYKINLKSESQRLILQRNIKLKEFKHQFKFTSKNRSESENNKLENLKKSLLKLSDNIIKNEEKDVTKIQSKLNFSTNKLIIKFTNELAFNAAQIKLMDPENLLKKGYSLTLKNGKTLSANNRVEIGDQIETLTSTNTIESIVKQIKPRKHGNN